MLVDDYIKEIRINAQRSTPRQLTLSPHLVDEFYRIWSRSENQALEMGCNLLFVGGALQTTPTITGQRTTINLNVNNITQNDNYIGDYHVHPYLRKMGKGAKVGPSSDDVLYWTNNRPKNFQIGVHFVASFDVLFLVAVRGVTLNFPRRGLRGISDPVGIANDYLYDIGEHQTMVDGLMRADDFKRAGNDKLDIRAQRTTWDSIPHYAEMFSLATSTFNMKLANALNYEYYVWEKERSSACVFELRSDAVYP